MLIVEGSDRVGKTTLCRKLTELLAPTGPWMYRHFGPLPKSWCHPWDYLHHMSRYVVQDRFHLSEWVYRRAEGELVGLIEPPELSLEKYRLIDACLRLLGSVTVVVTALQKTIVKRSGDSRAVEANRLFFDLPHTLDVDFHYHTSETNVSDDDVFIDRVLKLYLQRQELTREIHE